MEHVLTMANLKLKPSLFTPRPNAYSLFVIRKILVDNITFNKDHKENYIKFISSELLPVLNTKTELGCYASLGMNTADLSRNVTPLSLSFSMCASIGLLPVSSRGVLSTQIERPWYVCK